MVENEKEAAFLRLARARANRALEDIRKIGNLANRNNYDYSDEMVEKMFDHLFEALTETKALFKAKKKREFRF